MKSLYFLLGITLSMSSFATNSYCNLNFDYTNTGSNMTVFFTQPAVSNLNLEGTIGAFYINDNGDYNCGASMSFHGNQTQFAVMGDDSTTPQKDGFHAGEIVYWFFQAEDGSIFSLEIDPADSFELNAISIVSSVNVNEVDCGDDVINNGCETLDYNYTNTGVNMTFALPNSSIESISNLGNGSIGVFFSTNNDELICAGSSSLNGLETAFPIMGDDQTTIEVDGLMNNQDLLIIFTTTIGNQYLLTPYPTENFTPNGIYYVDEFEASLYCASSIDIYGCMDEAANNYNSNANLQDNSCTYDIEGCTDYQANNFNPQANSDDDSCTYNIYGCTDEEANNYNAGANINDYSCTYDVEGCTDYQANDYNPQANIDDDSCTYDTHGCTDINSCNFNADADIDDGSCIYGTDGNTSEFSVSPASWGGEVLDMNNVSLVHVGESLELGCDSYEFNFEGAIALIKRGECQFSQKALHAQNAGAAAVIIYNYSSGNISMGQGSYSDEIIIPVYAMNGNDGSELSSWIESTSNNNANIQEHTLYITTAAFDCEGNCLNDEDQDGVCDMYEITGCQDQIACNYNSLATDPGDCTYTDTYYNCEGNCITDADADGVCDELEIEGCLDIAACNFNSSATESNNSCEFNAENFDCNGNCINDTDNDGICDEYEDDTQGDCLSLDYNYLNTGTNMTFALPTSAIESIENLGSGSLGAFLFNSENQLICVGSTEHNGMETAFPIMGNDETTIQVDGMLNNQLLYLVFTAEDGTQYELTPNPNVGFEGNGIYYVNYFSSELIQCGDSIIGCMDVEANNYNADANIEDESCTYDVYGCMDTEANNYNSDANIEDESCTYDVYGCMDTEANNYNADANIEDESCTYDVYGCMDTEANNYNADANIEDELCTYDVYGCMDTEANNYNADANIEDESCTYDVYGCIDTEANNYNADANIEDESCTYDQDNCGCSDSNYIEYFTQGYYATCDDGSCEIPIKSSGITNNHFNTPLNTSVNSVIGFDLSSIYLPEGTIFGAFYDLNNDGQIGGNPVVSTMDEVYYECVGLSNYQNSFFTMAIWGDDPFSDDIDGVPSGSEDVIFAFLLPNQSVITFDFSPETFIFTSNGLMAVSSINLDLTIYGCTNTEACNFNLYADIDDGSCSGSYGCMEEMYVDFDAEASCHSEELCDDTWHDHLVDMEDTHGEVIAALDSSIALNNALTLELNNQTQISNSLENELVLANNTITGNEEEIASLLNEVFEISSNLDEVNTNISEIMNQLTEAISDNENLLSIIDDLTITNSDLSYMLDQAYETIESMENGMLNMQANMDTTLGMLTLSEENSQQLSIVLADMTNQMSEANESISDLSLTINNLNEENIVMQSTMTSLEETNIGMTDEIENLEIQNTEAQESIITLSYQLEEMIMLNENMSLVNDSLSSPILIDLISGWNIIGYTLHNPQDAVISFETIEDNLSVVKNNTGEVYWTDFGFNGIGDLIPGQGYQVLVNGDHEGFVFEDMGGLRVELSPTVPQWAVDMEIPIHPNDVRTLVRVVNILGQAVNAENEVKGSLLYYLYNDGSVEKRIK
jgi:hypothetical protein